MSRGTIALLENLCRTCMNGDKETSEGNGGKKAKAISIFNKPEIMECKNMSIMELLLLTAPQLNIDSGDMLPKILCTNCLESLISAYKFQRMCIRVEQDFRQIIKEEFPAEIQTNKDPLKDGLIDVSTENVAISQSTNDISNIFKMGIDEPLIDQDESDLCNKTLFIYDSKDIKSETDDNLWQDTSDTDEPGDTDSEWENLSHKAKRKKGSKVVVKKGEEVIQSLCDYKADEKTSRVSDESKINSNLSDIKQDESKRYPCEKCGNLLKTRKSLMQHKKIHLRNIDEEDKKPAPATSKVNDGEGKKFVCDECGNRFTTRKTLKQHGRIHLRPAKEDKRIPLVKAKHECEFCNKVFRHSISLKDHLRTHTGETPYLCSECGKAFNRVSSMKQHFRRHGTARPYACPDCPKRFPCSSDLGCHKAMHNKTKSHICDICGAAFMRACFLKTHKKYHTGEKNHKCDYCEMRFVLAEHCRRHMRTHTGEKPYKCKYCERAFSQSNDLIKHLRGHLGDNVYKCNLCPKGFRLRMDLRAHFNTHKNDDEETKVRNLQALKDEEHRLQKKFGLVNST